MRGKGGEQNNENEDEYEEDIYTSYYFIVLLIISIIAAVLSWDYNTKANYPLTVKLACSFTAFTFGFYYLIFYFYLIYNK